MVFHHKSRGDQSRQILGAPVKIEHPSAAATGKVVVMILPGQFVPLGFPGYFDCGQPTFFCKTADRTVYRGDAQVWNDATGAFQDLRRAQGPVSLAKDLSNGTTLNRIALHEKHPA
jgi:hypothetical protein